MLTREICKICYRVNRIGFKVSDRVWLDVVPANVRNKVVCLDCFSRIGDSKMVAWDQDIEFFPVSLSKFDKDS